MDAEMRLRILREANEVVPSRPFFRDAVKAPFSELRIYFLHCFVEKHHSRVTFNKS